MFLRNALNLILKEEDTSEESVGISSTGKRLLQGRYGGVGQRQWVQTLVVQFLMVLKCHNSGKIISLIIEIISLIINYIINISYFMLNLYSVYLINNVVLILCVQQSDSFIHIYTFILFHITEY